jgi:hypothetical protein
VHLFYLSLTDTAFAWFSSLTPGSIISWDMLECKFHDHFYSGSMQLKLTDLTSVRQGRDETVFGPKEAIFQKPKLLKII